MSCGWVIKLKGAMPKKRRPFQERVWRSQAFAARINNDKRDAIRRQAEESRAKFEGTK
jgi:hypothetical protein